MALWKKGKKVKDAQDTAQKVGSEEISETDVSFVTATEIPPTKEEPLQEEQVSESSQAVQEDLSGGVIMYGEKVSGVFRKGFWGIFSIIILPPVLVFAFGILVIIGMLIFPLLAVVLVASVPVVFVTLSILFIALPILFPLLIIFLLITGKGRLLIGSEGKWFGLEMFGKSYSLK
ncbi:MAG: hypothetical protein HY607_02270 [Planctomycetes bacterium]|uniref:hypothetical protein n=1 Tax=Candidatus Wunengus californicus TaxID=3367619 RepID=UPI00402689D2|nr:hypothetical protein [Planctomycetota bacterium]MBI4221495.1 hypothetical protein [Planctomycetota bacterium]